MQVTRTSLVSCGGTGEIRTREIDCTKSQMRLFESEFFSAKEVFPNLSETDQLFIAYGVTSEEYYAKFPKRDE